MILLYHNIYSERDSLDQWYPGSYLKLSSFKDHVQWLKIRYQIIPLDQYLKNLHNSDYQRKHVSITFDDGLKNTFDNIYPFLLQENIPVTIFVTKNPCNNSGMYWYSYLNAICFNRQYTHLNVQGFSFPLNTYQQCKVARTKLGIFAKESRDPDHFFKTLESAYPLDHTKCDNYLGITNSQLRTAVNSGLLEIGGHTMAHPYLSMLPKNRQNDEIEHNMNHLAGITGTIIRFFAYPSGDYDATTLEIVSKMGFDAAFAVASKQIGNEKKYEIERIGIYSPSITRLKIKLSPLFTFIKQSGFHV